MFILFFFLGMLFTIACIYALFRAFTKLKKKFAPRKYHVAAFSVNQTDGIYLMDFYLSDDLSDEAIRHGYTKKCPPLNAKPEDLTVTIRSYHQTRGLYRVFWTLKKN